MQAKLLAAIVALSLSLPLAADGTISGGLIDAQRLKWYPAWFFRTGLWIAKLPGKIPVTTGATLYRLTYWTRDWNDTPIQATGMIAIPHRRPLRGIVSYQHGTTTERNRVPSRPSIDAKLMAAAFAGGGYIVVAQDYIGLGGTPRVHPYLHADSAARAGIDLLRAASTYLARRSVEYPQRLNLVGFSQGGHATAAMQRAMERMNDAPLPIVAAAAAAGPFDLERISFPVALAGGANSHSVYLAYLVRGYAEVYGQPIATVIAEPFAAELPRLFDGTHDNDAIRAVLPRQPRAMFAPAFLAAFDNGERTWFTRALGANEVYDWAPRAPLRLYFGTADRDVAHRDSQFAAAAMAERGGLAEAIDVGPYDHEGSVFRAAIDIRRWFDTLNPKRDPAPE